MKKNTKGQMLIELVITMGLLSVLLPAILTGLVASREGNAQEDRRLQATAYLKEAEEIVRNIREKNWQEIANPGVYHPDNTGSATDWELSAGTQNIDNFTRQIEITNVNRNSSGFIVPLGGTPDPSTKKIVSKVSWSAPIASQVESTMFLTRHLLNERFLHTTQSDFNQGLNQSTTVTNGGPSPTGAVELVQNPASTTDYGNKFKAESTASMGNMQGTGTKSSMRFTARQGGSVSQIRVYVHTKTGSNQNWRFGIQTNSGGSPSGTWAAGPVTSSVTGIGWKTVNVSGSLSADNIYHLVVERTVPTSTNFIALRRSLPLNLLYPKTNVGDTSANTLIKIGASFPWSTLNFQPIYVIGFSDSTFEGNPYESTTETSIFGSNWVGEKFTVTGGNKTPQSISFYLRRNGNPPNNLTVDIRNNLNVSIYSGTIATTSLSTSFAFVTHNFTSAVNLTNGQTYRVILRTSGGNNNNSYRVYRINTTNDASYNSITYDNTSSVYTSSNNAGISWTDTNQSDIGGYYFTIQTPVGYPAQGIFESHATGSFDAGKTVAFNNIKWDASTPSGAALTLQVAISANSGGPWDYFGLDGTSGSSFATSAMIPLNRINGRYVRYKATLTSSGVNTPALNEISINYSP